MPGTVVVGAAACVTTQVARPVPVWPVRLLVTRTSNACGPAASAVSATGALQVVKARPSSRQRVRTTRPLVRHAKRARVLVVVRAGLAVNVTTGASETIQVRCSVVVIPPRAVTVIARR